MQRRVVHVVHRLHLDLLARALEEHYHLVGRAALVHLLAAAGVDDELALLAHAYDELLSERVLC